jgi:hypothetical protein
VTGKQLVIEIPSVEELLKESGLPKDAQGILLKELNRKMESDRAELIQQIGKIQDLQLEHLNKIVQEHSDLSKLYDEIKNRAQTKDCKIKEEMSKNRLILINDVFEMYEDTFVEVFKPCGHLNNLIMDALKILWTKSMKDQDQMMITHGSVVSANYRKYYTFQLIYVV